MAAEQTRYDALVAGGGPAGSTAALVMARAGMRVRLCERARFPRFHIGESFLPANLNLIRELGLADRLSRVPQTDKQGAEFVFADGRQGQLFSFSISLVENLVQAFNLERAPFDAMLLAAARDAGAEVSEDCGIRRILRLEEGDVEVETDAGQRLSAGVLVDASGQGTLVGRHLGLRRVMADHRKVAFFGHFTGVERRGGVEGGYPTIVMCDEGWFWIIPIDDRRDSIGLVMDVDAARRAGVPHDQMLAWGIARCPLVRRRTATASGADGNLVCADFSYRCEPFAGPGYFLAGDAATFLDPIFSTGVCMAMMSAAEAARGAIALDRRTAPAARVRRRYHRFVDRSTAPFFGIVRGYYDHSFRELFVNGTGPLQIHRAVIAVLAGGVFPRPVWRLRWRLALFHFLRRVNRHLPLVPRRQRFSLFGADAESDAAALRPEAFGPAVEQPQASPVALAAEAVAPPR